MDRFRTKQQEKLGNDRQTDRGAGDPDPLVRGTESDQDTDPSLFS